MRIRRRSGRLGAAVSALIVAGVTLGASSVATANVIEPIDYWSLPGISCAELFVPPGGELSYEDIGPSLSECAFDTPAGPVLYFWRFAPLSAGSAENWAVYMDEEAVAMLWGFQAVAESFGTFYEADSDGRELANFTAGRVDTGSTRWGVALIDRVEFVGPPEAIEAMVAATGDRVALLQQALAIDESPEYRQQGWELDALDCLDVWDRAGLDPGYEVATTSRYLDYLECVVVEAGANPFSQQTPSYLTFNFMLVDCSSGPADLQQATEGYQFQQEESFGTFHFSQNPTTVAVAGERTELEGVFADEQDCVLYRGWPEAIERMVAARSGVQSAGAEGQSVAPQGFAPFDFDTPSVMSGASLVGGLSAVGLAGVLLGLRRWLLRSPGEVESNPPAVGETTAPRGRRIARLGYVAAFAAVVVVALVALDPGIRAGVATGVVDLGLVVSFFALWGLPLLVAVALAVVIVVTQPDDGRLLRWPFVWWSLAGVIAGMVAASWQAVAIPLVPVIALLVSSAVFGTTPADHRRHTLLLWSGTLLSLGLFTVSTVDPIVAGLPDGVRNSGLIVLAIVIASTVVMAIPVASSPGHGSSRSHPVMWAGSLMVSWWMFVTAGDLSWLAAAVLVAVAVIVAVVTHLPGRKPGTDSESEPASVGH